MKIQYKVGDLIKSVHTDAIIHGCNAQGKMGSGFAKSLRDVYPEIFLPYAKECKAREMLGKNIPVHFQDMSIINAVTQQYYGRNPHFKYVDYLAVRQCFNAANITCDQHMYKTLNMPLIGAGLANGDWKIISGIVESECTLVRPVVWVQDIQTLGKVVEILGVSVDDIELTV